jgi:hypothetical protein
MASFMVKYGGDQLTFHYPAAKLESKTVRRDLLMRFGVEEGMEPMLLDSAEGRLLNLDEAAGRLRPEELAQKTFELLIKKPAGQSSARIGTEFSGEDPGERRSLTNTQQSRDWPGGQLLVCSLAGVRVLSDLHEFMKTAFRATTRLTTIFILRKQDWSQFNAMKLPDDDFSDLGTLTSPDIFVFCSPKKSDLVKYFYLTDPPFLAFYHPNKIDHVELAFEPQADHVTRLLRKAREPLFFKQKGAEGKAAAQPAEEPRPTRQSHANNDESKPTSSKGSPGSVSENGFRNPASYVLEKHLDDLLVHVQADRVCSGTLR